MREFHSHGDGSFSKNDLATFGKNVIFEKGIMIWHPETISLGNNVYLGHYAMLKGHPKGKMIIGNNTWIGQNAFIHSAGDPAKILRMRE